MLHEFLSTNREEIIARTREMVANRPAPRATQVELEKGIPLFLTQLIDMLKAPSQRSARVPPGTVTRCGGWDSPWDR
jgi:hypothetical protein